MTTTAGSRAVESEQVCPDLGLEGNPAVRCPFPTPLHRCFVGSVPDGLEVRHQSAFCLSGAYLECDRRSATSRILARHEMSDVNVTGLRVWWNKLPRQMRSIPIALAGLVAVVLLGVFKTTGSRGRSLALAGLIAVSLLVLGIQWIPSWAGMGPRDGGGAAPTVTAAPSPLVVAPVPASTLGTVATGSPSPQPAVSPTAASASPTATPTPSATPPPLPSATPEPKTHVVQAGDNLWTIATNNGITVDDLMRANGLVDRGGLEIGQRLVIPTPTPRPSPTP